MKLGNASAVRGMHEGLGRNLLGFGTGPSGAPSFVGALDDYTANLGVAWSVGRRLLSSYEGPLFRVRRSSDDAEQDIGFAANGLANVTALLAFVGAGNGFVTTRYDQSGNGNDASQATAQLQTQVVASGSANLDGVYLAEACTVTTRLALTVDLVDLVGSSSGVIVARMYAAAGTSGNRLIGASITDLLAWTPFADNQIYFDYGGSTSGRVNAAQPAGWDDAWHWLRLTRHSGTQSIHVDTTELVSASRTATNTSASVTLNVPLDQAGSLREMAMWTSGADAAAKEAAMMA